MTPQNSPLSYLDIVNLCGNARVGVPSPIPSEFDSEPLVPFYLSPAPGSPVIGLLRPQIIELLRVENSRTEAKSIWVGLEGADVTHARKISFDASLDTHTKRTAVMKEMCERWRDTGILPDIIGPKKWRAEMYPVYRDAFGVHDYPAGDAEDGELNFAFEMERAAAALFGVITYGVHMSTYQEITDPVSGERTLRLWIPTRAKNKSMWPGYLDNTVAGGIPAGMPMFEALVKECMEEASLPEELVRKHVRSVGCVSYFHRTSKGWLQPEVEYMYDMPIPPTADPTPFEPKPLDGEVERFDFLNKTQVEVEMRSARFKPNCAVVLIDLFIRLGYITPDNEPDFLKIVTALHTQFDYERWAGGA
ncbi:nudix hydrolase 20 [Mycena metata]|uniref:Nudix hydrolase 20 n=1 Tax=Mycena metata TaxID=1033252 RepID=A0AAD7N707_9AGAR|nr:nudix hydrolase 20 [Mycena metata]